jgi:hypothetical protein
MSWNTSDPPKDRPIVAVGGIMFDDGFSTEKFPFAVAIQWGEEIGEWMLCHGDHSTLRRTLEEKVIIHFWTEYPS